MEQIVSPTPADYRIEQLQGAALRAARRLLPEAFTAHTAPDQVFGAFGGHSSQLLGAAALTWRYWGSPPGFPVLIRVPETACAHAIARALLQRAVQACRQDTAHLHAWRELEEGCDEASFLEGLGFGVNRRVLHFDADLLEFKQTLDAVYRRVAQRGRLPDQAQVIPLRQAPRAPVARLVSEALGSRYEAVYATLQHGDASCDLDLSVVLLTDGTVSGAMMGRWRGQDVEVDAAALAPDLRRGWAYAALLERGVHAAVAAGARRFRFRCDEKVKETVNLVRRAKARRNGVTVEYTLPLDRVAPVAAP